jgi:hypothetical protein
MVNRATLQSTADSQRWRLERLAKSWLASAAEPGSLPRVGEKGEELRGRGGVLTGGNLERWNGEMDWTVMHKGSSR